MQHRGAVKIEKNTALSALLQAAMESFEYRIQADCRTLPQTGKGPHRRLLRPHCHMQYSIPSHGFYCVVLCNAPVLAYPQREVCFALSIDVI